MILGFETKMHARKKIVRIFHILTSSVKYFMQYYMLHHKILWSDLIPPKF